MSDVAPTPRPRVNFLVLLFGASAAPIFWLGQEMLAYIVSAEVCYGSDHPTHLMSDASLRGLLFAFDGVAVVAALAGAAVSFISWRILDAPPGMPTAPGRARYLAIWGMLSSAIFLLAILFNLFASIGAPACSAS